MKTITRGDPEKAQGNFHLGLYAIKSGSKVAETVHDVDIDVKEDFLIHTYRALVDFITDFQQTRSGKPSKSMLAQIQNWDPAFDLQRATNEQRLRWRRAYTINWLYDLVNLFSSIVVQRRTLRGQNIALEGVDWSVNGPWNEHRRLFGLNEFAGDITHLAMQTPGTNIRPKILPHHVFQLQCIVDSLSVSRGWLLNSFKGHVIIPPAPGFRPRRDVDLFMDRKNERSLKGFCAGADVLYQLFEKDAMLHGNPNRHKQRSEILDILRDDFVNWLGETKYMYGLTTIPPSRFSNSNSNGLWEYSPYLCGVGLMEALELAYNMGFLIWDEIPEPMCLIHLHNMLVQKGYITKPVGLYASLQELFPSSFFASGKVPTSNFSEALFAVLGETNSRRVVFNRKSLRRQAAQTSDIHGLLSTSLNRFFKTKSLLTLYRGADWVPDRIPDEEVPLVSLLAILRIGQTKRVTDPATGKTVLQETELVKRARSMGMDDATMMMMSSIPESGEIQETPESILSTLPEGYKPGRMLTAKRSGSAFNGSTLSSREVLTILKRDLMSDVSSVVRPLSSLNYVCVTVQFMFLFQRIEDELKRLRNPLWVEVYETNSKMAADKRATFTLLALAERNEECMEVMAKVFQDLRIGFLQHVYWDNLEPVDAGWDFLEEDEPEMTCTIM
ncbi:hypothetical protein PRK78_001629 [Emydomyces testavorans]|uniref:Uncharacterized protein n=1 Tax=Emydomyces testavorans TaxID=2070801 RepID=A0AAF0DD21_9EURO|nr:hypothetical protein PRK78_001629 [Emydomyces testavorans]